MTSSIFLAKNLAILFISVQSLEPCINDKILKESTILTLNKLFEIKNTSLTSYKKTKYSRDLGYLIILLDILLKISSQAYVQKAIQNTLIEVGSIDPDSKVSSSYIKRFEYQYYRLFKSYIVGYSKYNDTTWIKKISLINLVLLEKLPGLYPKYHILLYLLYNSSN